MNHYLYYLLPIVGWSIPNFFIKNLRKVFDSVEIIVLLHILYKVCLNNNHIHILYNLTIQEKMLMCQELLSLRIYFVVLLYFPLIQIYL